MNLPPVVVAWSLLQVAPCADLDSVLSLSALPLDKLLHVRRSLTRDPDIEDYSNDLEGSGLPEALPLSRVADKDMRDKTFGGGYFEDDWKGEQWAEEYPWKEEHSWKDKLKEKFKEHFSKFHHKKKKKNKIQKIFQISITLLAFLAFGGYLVALVLTSMRQQDLTLVSTTLTPLAQARIHRREASNSSDTDLYLALRRLSEGYARYNEQCQL